MLEGGRDERARGEEVEPRFIGPDGFLRICFRGNSIGVDAGDEGRGDS